MLPLIRHKHADQDFNEIIQEFKSSTGQMRKRLKGAVGRIAFVLESMESDEEMQQRLLEHNEEEDGGINFQKWITQHKLGNDLWRVKLWSGPDLVRYRIIYAYEKVSQSNVQARFHVLAIVDRDKFDYEPEDKNPLSARIVNDYRNI